MDDVNVNTFWHMQFDCGHYFCRVSTIFYWPFISKVYYKTVASCICLMHVCMRIHRCISELLLFAIFYDYMSKWNLRCCCCCVFFCLLHIWFLTRPYFSCCLLWSSSLIIYYWINWKVFLCIYKKTAWTVSHCNWCRRLYILSANIAIVRPSVVMHNTGEKNGIKLKERIYSNLKKHRKYISRINLVWFVRILWF